jgi:hypothetical protein
MEGDIATMAMKAGTTGKRIWWFFLVFLTALSRFYE